MKKKVKIKQQLDSQQVNYPTINFAIKLILKGDNSTVINIETKQTVQAENPENTNTSEQTPGTESEESNSMQKSTF